MSETQLLQSYLFAYIFWISVTLGCSGLLLLFHATKGRWGLAVLRLIEAGARNLPLMVVLFVPIVFAVWTHRLYPWAMATPEQIAHDSVLKHKMGYQNPPFFTVRAAFYFLLWYLFSRYLLRSSLRQEETRDPIEVEKRASVAAPGLVVFVLTVTFAFTDWVMSLDIHWSSTIYGIWFVAGLGLAGTAFITLLATAAALLRREPFVAVVTPRLTRDLGNLLLTFTLFWAYISLSQYIIIWAANLPEEIRYYLRRSAGTWNWIITFVMAGQFFGPFLALLSGRTKRTLGLLMPLAAWIFFVHMVDVFWIVVPAFGSTPGVGLGTHLVMLVLIGLIWLAVYRRQLGKASLLPRYDPVTQEALEHA